MRRRISIQLDMDADITDAALDNASLALKRLPPHACMLWMRTICAAWFTSRRMGES